MSDGLGGSALMILPAVRVIFSSLPMSHFFALPKKQTVTLQALSSTPTNPHSCFAWSYKALAMLVDCMWSFGWRLEGGGEDHKACNLFELAISYCGF